MKLLILLFLMLTFEVDHYDRTSIKPPVDEVIQSKGYALLIGLERIDTEKYRRLGRQYDATATAGAKDDMANMKRMLQDHHFEITELRDNKATSSEMLKSLKNIGKKIKSNDLFVFYYTGHGDSVTDLSGDEKSGCDQVFVTYDKPTLDDSIQVYLSKYFIESRNVMIVDACHSGTSYQLYMDFPINDHGTKPPFFPEFVSQTNAENQASYAIKCEYDQLNEVKQSYSLIYYGATADKDVAGGSSVGSVLTRAMEDTFQRAQFPYTWHRESYQTFACKVGKIIKKPQRLQYHEIGKVEDTFKNSQPFKIK